jgi:hypothetical protein
MLQCDRSLATSPKSTLTLSSSADGDADWFAPLTDAGVADAIDGLVGPFHRRGREGLGVYVARGGIVGEQDETFTVVAIDLDFAQILRISNHE